jgi:[ribosomal protein S5]-alanine N-acetyltransferase
LPTEYFLRTPRLGFRNWSSGDLPLALALFGDAQVTRLIGGPFSHDKVKARLATEIANLAEFDVQYWPMFLLAGDDFAGCCGLRPYALEKGIYELGYNLLPCYWGKGLAEEAARGIIAFAFEQTRVTALFAGHHPENAASRRILQKLGFRYTHDELYPPTGAIEPVYLLEKPESA